MLRYYAFALSASSFPRLEDEFPLYNLARSIRCAFHLIHAQCGRLAFTSRLRSIDTSRLVDNGGYSKRSQQDYPCPSELTGIFKYAATLYASLLRRVRVRDFSFRAVVSSSRRSRAPSAINRTYESLRNYRVASIAISHASAQAHKNRR